MSKDGYATGVWTGVEGERDWEALVRASEQGSPFSMMPWLTHAAELAGARVERRVINGDAGLLAGQAVAYRSVAGRRVYVGLPFAAYSSPLVAPFSPGGGPGGSSRFLAIAGRLAEETAAASRLTSLYCDPTLTDVRPWIWAGWRATPRYTYLWSLESPARLSDSVRRHVRKCREAGHRIVTEWNWDLFQPTFEDTMRRQRIPLTYGVVGLRRLAEAMREADLAWMLTAVNTGGEPLASHVVLSMPGAPRAYMWMAGTSTRHLSSGAGAWIMTEVAAEARRRGHVTWDLCGADFPSVARFKSEFGATLAHYFMLETPPTLFGRVYRMARYVAGRGR